MVYDFLGKKMTRKEVHNELLYNPKITSSHICLIHAQDKINAERRMNNETDPYKKALMEEMYRQGKYDFDCYLGEE